MEGTHQIKVYSVDTIPIFSSSRPLELSSSQPLEIMRQFPRRRLFFDAINFRLDTSSFSPRLVGKFDFDNGYSASVICHEPHEPNRRYELAVLHDGSLCFDTPVTDDVVCFCNVAEIEDLLEQIACLPAKSDA